MALLKLLLTTLLIALALAAARPAGQAKVTTRDGKVRVRGPWECPTKLRRRAWYVRRADILPYLPITPCLIVTVLACAIQRLTEGEKARHTLSDRQKRAYIDAELCLMRTPARFGLPGARTVFDELQAVHIRQAEIIHFVVSDTSISKERRRQRVE